MKRLTTLIVVLSLVVLGMVFEKIGYGADWDGDEPSFELPEGPLYVVVVGPLGDYVRVDLKNPGDIIRIIPYPNLKDIPYEVPVFAHVPGGNWDYVGETNINPCPQNFITRGSEVHPPYTQTPPTPTADIPLNRIEIPSFEQPQDPEIPQSPVPVE